MTGLTPSRTLRARTLSGILAGLAAMVSMPGLNAQDTVSVRVLDRELVITDPGQGVRFVGRTVKLPSAELPVRRILLTLTYACPDSMRCADWDYLDHVLVRPLNSPDTFELARMLTPYGGLFKRDWQFSWVSDVSDLQTVLRDSVEVIHVHHGYEPFEDRGWAVTLDLRYITGPPIAPVLGIRELFRGHYAMGDDNHPLEEVLKPVEMPVQPGAEWLTIRSQQTGHGMNPEDGCGEFCAKWRSISVDGQEVQRRRLWKECASNPLSPQAGTWIFDRADWCPGELQAPDRVTVPLGQGNRTAVVHFSMEPYSTDSSTAFTNLSAYAVYQGRPTARHDAMITEVLVPSDEARHARMNEHHDGARIVIANAGADTLRTLSIRYGLEGDLPTTFNWQGALPFGACDTIDLPGPISHRPEATLFKATVEGPNGYPDAWPADNTVQSRCPAVDVLPAGLLLRLRTNNEPEHNALSLRDSSGRTWIDHSLGSLHADTLYTDSLELPPGIYRLQLTDTAGDGLTFWFNSEGGQGHLRLLDRDGRLLKRFESDCGNGITYHFRVGGPPTVVPDTLPAISLFPRRIKGVTRLDLFANEAAPIIIRVTDEDGQVVQELRPNEPVKEASFTLDLTGSRPGRYAVTVEKGGREVFRERLRLEN